MANAYLQELSQAIGLPYYQQHSIFGGKDGAVIGARDGYIAAVGFGKNSGGNTAVTLLLRHANGAGGSAGMLESLKAAGTKFSFSGAEDGALVAHWTYSFGKPKVGEIAEAVKKLIGALRIAPRFAGKCEVCQSATTSAITLRNDVPGYYCLSCQERLIHQGHAVSEEYDRLETNLPRGLLFGVVAALAGSLAWGLVAYAINYIFLWGAVLIGFLVGKAVYRGIGKINLVGQAMVFVLTILSVMFGDVIFYTLSVMKAENIPFSMDLVTAIVTHFWEIETSEKGGVMSILFAIVGAGVVVYSQRKPSFTEKFVALEGSKAAGAGV
jgi:hypothetical protein